MDLIGFCVGVWLSGGDCFAGRQLPESQNKLFYIWKEVNSQRQISKYLLRKSKCGAFMQRLRRRRMAPPQPLHESAAFWLAVNILEFVLTSFQLEISLFWDEGPGDTYMGGMQKGLVAAFAAARSTIRAHLKHIQSTFRAHSEMIWKNSEWIWKNFEWIW